MTAEDLARWDIGMIDQKLLKPASYRQMQTDTLLKNGLGIRYGLGITVSRRDGRRVLEHGGEVSGFTAENAVFPDDRAAIVVLVNQDSIGTSGTIGQRIAGILFAQGGAGPAEARARQVMEGLQKGKVDRAIFTSNANSYFTDQALGDFASSLGPLGAIKEIKQTTQQRPRRDDVPALRGEVSGQVGVDLGAGHAGREDRAVPGDAGGVAGIPVP